MFNLKLIAKLHKFNSHKIFDKIINNHFINVSVAELNSFFLDFLIDKMKLNINVLNFHMILRILHQLYCFLIVAINDD